jgi:hypothetical protein
VAETSRVLIDPQGRVERHAQFTPSPLPAPPGPVVARETIPPPTEAELRAQLRGALAAKQAAVAAATECQEALERGLQHLTRCQTVASRYIGLETELAREVSTALRSGGTVPDLSQDTRSLERSRAQLDLVAAEQAVATFRAELAQAAHASGDATGTVDALAAQLLALKAEELTEEARELQARMDALVVALTAYSRFGAAFKLGLPIGAGQLVGDVGPQQLYRANPQPWIDALAKLVADPDAAVDVVLPTAIKRPLPAAIGTTGWPPPMAPGRLPDPLPTPPGMQDDGDMHLVELDAQEITHAE